ncbi:MAG: ATP-binding protein [Oscillospiraceae bacterium]|nr:ATP-binding protein [Oscillospiraceae bacterium]
MLIQFSVRNFLSFKEKQTFTTLASTDKSQIQNLINYKDKDYSKINVIYGANASGKTNLIKAISFVREFIINSSKLLEGSPIPVIPFKFSKGFNDGKSSFELIFVTNNIRYEYSFICDKNNVYEEALYMNENGREALVFDRTNINNYEFKSDKTILEGLKERNTNNKLFLATAATWNYARVKPVVDYIVNNLFVLFDYNINMGAIMQNLKLLNEYNDFKKFALKILEQGDFTISDFSMKEQKIAPNDPLYNNFLNMITSQFPAGTKLEEVNLNEIKFNTIHNITENNKTNPYMLELNDESFGTQNLFNFTAILYDVLKRGKVLLVDEIDRSIHPLLVEYIVRLFIDESINRNNAQLIFNTHDTNLLSLDLFRRDEIWFAERNVDTGSTTLYPLTDYSPRKDENIQKGYLVGRYGGIPFITNDINIWEE